MKQVPQITPKGVSGDYVNAFGRLANAIAFYKIGGDDSLFGLAKIKTYEEYFPLDEYVGVITDENRETVEELTGLANKLKGMLNENSRDTKQYRITINQMLDLIYTDGRQI